MGTAIDVGLFVGVDVHNMFDEVCETVQIKRYNPRTGEPVVHDVQEYLYTAKFDMPGLGITTGQKFATDYMTDDESLQGFLNRSGTHLYLGDNYIVLPVVSTGYWDVQDYFIRVEPDVTSLIDNTKKLWDSFFPGIEPSVMIGMQASF